MGERLPTPRVRSVPTEYRRVRGGVANERLSRDVSSRRCPRVEETDSGRRVLPLRVMERGCRKEGVNPLVLRVEEPRGTPIRLRRAVVLPVEGRSVGDVSVGMRLLPVRLGGRVAGRTVRSACGVLDPTLRPNGEPMR